jgi:hypothetical protein
MKPLKFAILCIACYVLVIVLKPSPAPTPEPLPIVYVLPDAASITAVYGDDALSF